MVISNSINLVGEEGATIKTNDNVGITISELDEDDRVILKNIEFVSGDTTKSVANNFITVDETNNGADIVLSNITIASKFQKSGIAVHSGNVTVKDSTLKATDTFYQSSGGFQLLQFDGRAEGAAVTAVVENCVLENANSDESASWASNGVLIMGTADVDVSDCQFTNCYTGISSDLFWGYDNVVNHNNQAGYVLNIDIDKSNVFTGGTFVANEFVWVENAPEEYHQKLDYANYNAELYYKWTLDEDFGGYTALYSCVSTLTAEPTE